MNQKPFCGLPAKWLPAAVNQGTSKNGTLLAMFTLSLLCIFVLVVITSLEEFPKAGVLCTLTVPGRKSNLTQWSLLLSVSVWGCVVKCMKSGNLPTKSSTVMTRGQSPVFWYLSLINQCSCIIPVLLLQGCLKNAFFRMNRLLFHYVVSNSTTE